MSMWNAVQTFGEFRNVYLYNFSKCAVYSPAGVSFRSSVQRCTRRPNIAKPRDMACSSNADRVSPWPSAMRNKMEILRGMAN